MKVVFIFWAALAGPAARAQDPSAGGSPALEEPPPVSLGAVEIRLVDPSGAPWAGLPGAEVILTREGEAPIALLRTDAGFAGRGLPPGIWAIEATAPGLPGARGTLEVPAGGQLRADLVLDPGAEGIEEVVVVARTEAELLERSAQAVTVVDTEVARTQSADLGEVLARSQSVGVRRSGGLGSESRLSLGGLTDDQIRTFLDGVPLDLAGYPGGLAGVPVDRIERVEVYRGVVPVRLGADALGGAVNLVAVEPDDGWGGSLSYQGGSFDTHRLAAQLLARARWGGFLRASGQLDVSENDYPVEVEVPDERGRLSPARVRRFHDAYRARSGSVELGLSERRWADLASLRLFAGGTDQELQHNVAMTVPYGEARSSVDTRGAAARWRLDPSPALSLDALAGYTATTRRFVDLTRCVYDWFGQCVRERTLPGEITPPGADQSVWDHGMLARLLISLRPSDAHGLTLSVAPTTFARTGEDRLYDGEGSDPLASRREATQVVSGIEHQLDLADARLENLSFVKHYAQIVHSEEPTPAGPRDAGRSTSRVGLGDALALALGPGARIKASWEWATRLPTLEEIFGDAALVRDNPALVPETSHNANLGLTLERAARLGELRLDASALLGEASHLIVLLGDDRSFAWHNVYGARSIGAEGALGWTSPGRWVTVDANGAWLSLRNTSSEGLFGDYLGDRIPNRPWLLANAALTLGASGVAAPDDRLTLDLYSRYVHPFLRSWESVGDLAYKQQIPAQLSHTVAGTYSVDTDRAHIAASIEVQNLTDADLYDFFGVQRPGRAAFGKLSLAW